MTKKFINRRPVVVGQVSADSLGMTSHEKFWKNLWQFQGYNMALIEPREYRAEVARVLIDAAKKLKEAPLPAWQRCIDDPDYFDNLGRRIKSGEYEDEMNRRLERGNKEALDAFGLGG